MRLFYAGQELSASASDGGGVEGFLPSGDQAIQVEDIIRADWKTFIARGNRQHTFSFTIHFPPESLGGLALQKLTTFFTGLPSSGALVWSESGYTMECESVVLQSFAPVYRIGVARAVRLTFLGGRIDTLATPETSETNLITTEDGESIFTEDGSALLTES